MPATHRTMSAQTTTDTAADLCRFAELVARAGLEPDLKRRYTSDPASVFAEFGLLGAEPVYTAPSLVIENLGRPDATATTLLTGIPYAV